MSELTDRLTDRPTKPPLKATSRRLKKDPKIKSRSNVRIEGNIENNSCCTKRIEPKTLVEPANHPQNSPFGPINSQKPTLKLDRIKSNN